MLNRRELLAKVPLLALPALLPLGSINLAGKVPGNTSRRYEDEMVARFIDDISEISPGTKLKYLSIRKYTNGNDYRIELKLNPKRPYGLTNYSGFLCNGNADIQYISNKICEHIRKITNEFIFIFTCGDLRYIDGKLSPPHSYYMTNLICLT